MSFNKKTVRTINLKGKRALVRVDFNVPYDDQMHILDDTRIRASLPTLQYILDQGGSLILMSHLGRPKGKVVPSMSLQPTATALSEMLGRNVLFAPEVLSVQTREMAAKLRPGEVMLLENLRFHKEEEANDRTFCSELAALGDVYINDAFGTAHRAHASTAGVAEFFQAKAAGFLIEKEYNYLQGKLGNPEKPFYLLLGGSKVSDKILVLEKLLPKADGLLIGGAMAYAFLRAQGGFTGNSKVSAEDVPEALKILKAAKAQGIPVYLPCDHLIAETFDKAAPARYTEDAAIPEGWMGLDIGPKTVAAYRQVILGARTAFWNGPMGVYEFPQAAKGTRALAETLREVKGTTVVAGGDVVAAVMEAGVESDISHVSTGGGASLELLEGKELPGVAVLEDC